MLTNSYFIAFVIPLILLLCGAVARKLVRGSGWKHTDFFLGVELTLAALGSDMVYFYDLQKLDTATDPTTVGIGITRTATFLVISFFLLLWVLSTHQDWEGRTQDPKGQISEPRFLLAASLAFGLGAGTRPELLVTLAPLWAWTAWRARKSGYLDRSILLVGASVLLWLASWQLPMAG